MSSFLRQAWILNTILDYPIVPSSKFEVSHEEINLISDYPIVPSSKFEVSHEEINLISDLHRINYYCKKFGRFYRYKEDEFRIIYSLNRSRAYGQILSCLKIPGMKRVDLPAHYCKIPGQLKRKTSDQHFEYGERDDFGYIYLSDKSHYIPAIITPCCIKTALMNTTLSEVGKLEGSLIQLVDAQVILSLKYKDDVRELDWKEIKILLVINRMNWVGGNGYLTLGYPEPILEEGHGLLLKWYESHLFYFHKWMNFFSLENELNDYERQFTEATIYSREKWDIHEQFFWCPIYTQIEYESTYQLLPAFFRSQRIEHPKPITFEHASIFSIEAFSEGKLSQFWRPLFIQRKNQSGFCDESRFFSIQESDLIIDPSEQGTLQDLSDWNPVPKNYQQSWEEEWDSLSQSIYDIKMSDEAKHSLAKNNETRNEENWENELNELIDLNGLIQAEDECITISNKILQTEPVAIPVLQVQRKRMNRLRSCLMGDHGLYLIHKFQSIYPLVIKFPRTLLLQNIMPFSKESKPSPLSLKVEVVIKPYMKSEVKIPQLLCNSNSVNTLQQDTSLPLKNNGKDQTPKKDISTTFASENNLSEESLDETMITSIDMPLESSNMIPGYGQIDKNDKNWCKECINLLRKSILPSACAFRRLDERLKRKKEEDVVVSSSRFLKEPSLVSPNVAQKEPTPIQATLVPLIISLDSESDCESDPPLSTQKELEIIPLTLNLLTPPNSWPNSPETLMTQNTDRPATNLARERQIIDLTRPGKTMPMKNLNGTFKGWRPPSRVIHLLQDNTPIDLVSSSEDDHILIYNLSPNTRILNGDKLPIQ